MTSRDFLASTPLFALLQLLIVAVILFTLGRVIEQTLFLGRKPPLLGSWLSRLRWACPLTHKMDRDQGLADVCGLMADALRAGATVPAAIYETLSLPVNVVLHDRLAMWASLHTQGAPLGAAAEQAMLPRLMSSLLATTGPSAAPGDPTSNASGLSDALDFLQRYYRGQFSRIIVFLRGALEPACVLMLGFIVGTVVVALFYPLVVLINTVIAASPNAGGY